MLHIQNAARKVLRTKDFRAARQLIRIVSNGLRKEIDRSINNSREEILGQVAESLEQRLPADEIIVKIQIDNVPQYTADDLAALRTDDTEMADWIAQSIEDLDFSMLADNYDDPHIESIDIKEFQEVVYRPIENGPASFTAKFVLRIET